MDEPLDLSEIAALFGVDEGTPKQWDYRGMLPAPIKRFRRGALWERSVIVEWGIASGRLNADGSPREWNPATQTWE